MEKKSGSLKRFIHWMKTSILGILFLAALIFVLCQPARAKEANHGHPVQRTTVADVTCTKIRDGDKTNFLVASKEASNLTYKKVTDCLELVKKSTFIIVSSNELNLTSRTSAKFEDITCLKLKRFVISFSGDAPLNLEPKTQNCFTRAKEIYDYKNNSVEWI